MGSVSRRVSYACADAVTLGTRRSVQSHPVRRQASFGDSCLNPTGRAGFGFWVLRAGPRWLLCAIMYSDPNLQHLRMEFGSKKVRPSK